MSARPGSHTRACSLASCFSGLPRRLRSLAALPALHLRRRDAEARRLRAAPGLRLFLAYDEKEDASARVEGGTGTSSSPKAGAGDARPDATSYVVVEAKA